MTTGEREPETSGPLSSSPRPDLAPCGATIALPTDGSQGHGTLGRSLSMQVTWHDPELVAPSTGLTG